MDPHKSTVLPSVDAVMRYPLCERKAQARHRIGKSCTGIGNSTTLRAMAKQTEGVDGFTHTVATRAKHFIEALPSQFNALKDVLRTTVFGADVIIAECQRESGRVEGASRECTVSAGVPRWRYWKEQEREITFATSKM
ncbi:hypothetical protein K470DRAFT_156616 [Piedraia hortae CBS 480.64]|uniref:Uncharacterized protein n=1 Tax=Piedraia hortae CBS 480.64 TaxID=1314780 RepID=A0A6A7BSV7_9PEZI|nr:hypothetical protein K470DRAFT_156616 [Piedraia hortae CBS 480.64]